MHRGVSDVCVAARARAALRLSAALLALAALAGPAAAAATVSVTDYGADPSGNANSTTAFKSAIAALDAQGGGTLVVPSGTYLIDPDQVNIHGNTTVAGTGATLLSSGTGYSLLGLSGSTLEVDGLTVDGNNGVLHLVEIGKGLTNVTLRGATVQNAGQSADPTSPLYSAPVVGIRVEGGGSTMVFDSINVSNVVATHSDGTSMVARGLLLDNGGGATTVTKHVQVTNSSFSQVAPKDDGDCLAIQNSSDTDADLLIQNNTFSYCYKRAIKLQVGGVTVQGNQISNPFFGDDAYQVRPETYDPQTGRPTFDMFSAVGVLSSNIAVTGNTTDGSGSFYQGVELDRSGTLQNITISGNTLGNGPGSETVAPSSLVRSAQPISGLTITSNTLRNAPYGLYLEQPVSQATIRCNSYVDVANQTATPYGTEQPCPPPAAGLEPRAGKPAAVRPEKPRSVRPAR